MNMSKLTIEIIGDNAAFYYEDGSVCKNEYSSILRNMANRVQAFDFKHEAEHKITDINGNVCGTMKLTVE